MGQRADDLTARREPADTDQDAEFAENTLMAREDIEFTRTELSSTIDAIQNRLDPEVLSEQAKDTAHDVTDYAIREAKEAAREITDHAIEQAREAVQDITGQARRALRDATVGKVETMARTATDTAGGWRQSMTETIKANPMPAALVGLGIGWMLLNRPSGSSPRSAFAAERVGQVADQAQQTASQAAQDLGGTASQVVEQVQATGGQVMDEVQSQASRAQGFLSRQLEENPLLVGAVAVAIGGVLAGTVPSTQREDEMLGAARDRLMDSGRDLTQETMQKVGRVIDEVQSTAQEKAKEESLMAPDARSQ